MTRKDFYRYIDTPTLLTADTLPELARLVEAFPCFHAARMLYLKNLARVGDLRFKGELEHMAICVPDRAQLFLLLSDERFARPPHAADAPARRPETDEVQGACAEAFDPSATTDYLRWLTDDEPPSSTAENRMRHQDLIDTFIAHGSEQLDKRRLMRAVADSEEDISTTLKDDGAEDDDKWLAVSSPPKAADMAADSSYFTETLAHVYIRQKRYAKALEIIRSLSEKHPEKNIYFADQIRFLEKLVEHTKP